VTPIRIATNTPLKPINTGRYPACIAIVPVAHAAPRAGLLSPITRRGPVARRLVSRR
jgi:hypothetical protein